MQKYVQAIKKRTRKTSQRFKDAYNALFLDKKVEYVVKEPHFQNALDIFEGEWISNFPEPFHQLNAGKANLFADPRIEWAIEQLGGMENKKVLELGPLEGAHSYMLQKHGASSIAAIEANPRAYLRCLVVKQMMNLNRVDFMCGDFMEYMRKNSAHFDFCLASGVLYHMSNPVEMIALCAKRSSQLYLWTHYYDAAICKKNPTLSPLFPGQEKADYQGFKHTLNRYLYRSARSWNTFCGGPLSFSNWLTRQDIIDACRYFGFEEIQTNFETPDHPHGPCFSLVASKKKK